MWPISKRRRATQPTRWKRSDKPQGWLLLEDVEKFFDLLSDLFGLCGGAIARDNPAFAVNEKFGEVPFDASCAEDSQHSGLAALEELVERVGLGAVHIDFGENGKGHAIILLAECADFSFRPWLLSAELVAGKGKRCKATLHVRTVKLFEARVLRGKSALAGGVDDEQNLSPEVCQADQRLVGAGIEERGRKIIDGLVHFRKTFSGWKKTSTRDRCPGGAMCV